MIARLEFLKVALVSVLVAAPCLVRAQVYDVGPAPSKPASVQSNQPQANQPQAENQSLGWGSNIQNARLARAAQLALQRGDRAQALDYARRAAEAAPSDPQLWFLLGYAARLNSKFTESVDAYSKGLHLSPSSLEGQSGRRAGRLARGFRRAQASA